MDFGDEFDLEHYIFKERKCRSCLKTKELVSMDFYKIRKTSGPSAYSCSAKDLYRKNRIRNTRKVGRSPQWEYPDW